MLYRSDNCIQIYSAKNHLVFGLGSSFGGPQDNALLNCVCTRATLLHFMPDPNQKRTNSALWLGLLITVPGPRGSTWPYQPSACSSF
jgi:hypothetical protein